MREVANGGMMYPPWNLPMLSVPYAPSATHSTNASTAQGRCPLRELTDAILSADAAVPSPVHLLSLQAPHRRGWGRASTPRWTAGGGSRNAEALRGLLLARNPLLAGGGDEPPVYAVNVSVWPRCDAEARAPSAVSTTTLPATPPPADRRRMVLPVHRQAQQLRPRELDRPPGCAQRVRPAQEDANEVAAEQVKQVKAFLRRSPEEGAAPLFVFDAGYDDPVKLPAPAGAGGEPPVSPPCQILVRLLRAGRRFYADPSLAGPPVPTGRPRRHGPKMKWADPSTCWPEPSAEYTRARMPVTERCVSEPGQTCI